MDKNGHKKRVGSVAISSARWEADFRVCLPLGEELADSRSRET
jgi:hypothetical protein